MSGNRQSNNTYQSTGDITIVSNYYYGNNAPSTQQQKQSHVQKYQNHSHQQKSEGYNIQYTNNSNATPQSNRYLHASVTNHN